jgi:hypothetical protein
VNTHERKVRQEIGKKSKKVTSVKVKKEERLPRSGKFLARQDP